jgi:hypothetical protein
MAPTLHLIESGPAFEVYQGPFCVQRHDWLTKGVFRQTVVGYATIENAEISITRYSALQRPGTRWTKLYDWWDLTSYEPQFRLELLKWVKLHGDTTERVYSLSRSKVGNMGLAVTKITVGELLTNYDKRADFDVVCKKLGLPVKPLMPTPTSAGSPEGGV